MTESHLMVPNMFTTEQLIPMLFNDDYVRRLRAADGLVEPNSNVGSYTIRGDDVYIHLGFKEARLPTPTNLAYEPYPERCGELNEAVFTITQIREKYAAVKWLLRWFNANATPAAVRAIWPSVLTLCPDSPLCKEYPGMPSRYTAPEKVGALLPLIRDTAQTVAGMQLIPTDAVPRARNLVWLTFNSGSFIREDAEISGDVLHVNL